MINATVSRALQTSFTGVPRVTKSGEGSPTSRLSRHRKRGKNPRDFTFLHLMPALNNFAAIMIYFAPAAVKGQLAAAFATYINRLPG